MNTFFVEVQVLPKVIKLTRAEGKTYISRPLRTLDPAGESISKIKSKPSPKHDKAWNKSKDKSSMDETLPRHKSTQSGVTIST